MIVVHTNVMVRLVVGGPGGAGAAWLFLRDAEFVVAARELGVRLATLNRAILRGFPDVALDTGDA